MEQNEIAPWEKAQKYAENYFANVAEVEQSASNTDVEENTPWGRAQAYFQQATSGGGIPQEKSKSTSFDMKTYIGRLSNTESSNNPNARNTKSTATGMFQFIESTWMDWTNKLGLDYTLEDRKDPNKAEVVVRAFTEANREKAQKALGREPNMVETYMYHLLGDANKFMKAPEEALAKDLATPLQVKKNKSVFFKKNGEPRTKGEVMERFERKFK